MKKLLSTVILTAAMLNIPAMAADVKIGVINARAVVANAPQREAIAEKLNAEFSERIEEIKKMREEGQAMQEKGQRDAATMSAQQKTDLMRQLESKAADIKLKEKALKEDMERRQQEEMRGLLAQVQQGINAVAEQEGYDLILQGESVAYANDKVNLTEKVIQMISKPGK